MLILTCFSVEAQQYFKVSTVPVSKNGESVTLMWEGGLNAPQFSEIDLDFDGIKELFLFDRSNNHITLLKRNGANGFLPFIPTHNYFPKDLNSWVLLRDANCDGKEDIFSYGNQGNVAVYLNTSTSSTISFESSPTLLKAYFNYQGGDFTTQIYVGGSDLPSITDIDNDGDLDILTFAFAGTTIEFYKNLSVEHSQQCGLDYELKNGCWAYLEEGVSTNDLLLGRKTCDNQVKNPEKSGFKHSGSTLLNLDLDGDNIQDLLVGDISFQNIVQVKLKKSSLGGDSAVSQDASFPTNTDKVDIPIFPATAYLDLTNDGIKDLVAFPNNPNAIHNFEGIWLYKNSGTNGSPVFNLTKKGFLQDQMLDAGEHSSGTFTDIDNDGLLDLIISGRGKSDGNGTYLSALSYYRNVGTKSQPAFQWITDDLGNISQMGLGAGLRPIFTDIDTDGKSDLILGNFNGTLSWIKYTAGNLNSFALHQFSMTDAGGATIDVGDYSHPAFGDLNKDGKPDLIIGERGGNLNYYQNTGSLSSPMFTKVTDTLGHVNAGAYLGDFGFSAPQLIPKNGGFELLLGTRSGKIKRYAINNVQSDFTLLNDWEGGIREGDKLIPFSADINNDGLADLLLGNFGGGVQLYYQRDPNAIIENQAVRALLTYPNPAKDLLIIENGSSSGLLEISDLQGRVILKLPTTVGKTQLDISGLSNGLYLLKLGNLTSKFIISK